MLVYFTESKSQRIIGINPKHVVSTFVVEDNSSELDGKTYITTLSGGVSVNESLDQVFQLINNNL